MFSPLSDVPDDVEVIFQKDVTFEEEQQLVLSENKLTAIKSSLLVLAPDIVLPVDKLTATESSTLLPGPPILINSKVVTEPQHHSDNLSRCQSALKSKSQFLISIVP
jgi:hypothetical protein